MELNSPSTNQMREACGKGAKLAFSQLPTYKTLHRGALHPKPSPPACHIGFEEVMGRNTLWVHTSLTQSQRAEQHFTEVSPYLMILSVPVHTGPSLRSKRVLGWRRDALLWCYKAVLQQESPRSFLSFGW